MTPLQGLYVITPEGTDRPDVLADQVGRAIAGGARIVQYREKGRSRQEQYDRANAVLQICRAAGVPLVINDDVTLAAELGAEGVHLGRDDGDPLAARDRLGTDAIVGVSCYDDLARARAAARRGASYVAFGSFFPSPTKPDAVRASRQLLAAASRCMEVPLVAIGGITPKNGPLLIAAGARMLAIISGVFAQPDVTAAARTYASLFPAGDPR
ncbi:MAG: thiamine phosphate synthase [Thiocapsa sp.]|nr:thiamine phosphate synthase [Thiocapsa sp.]MCG6897537.1 thiamine phosphate synthase [Thiocapsa sp.]